ncbi:hypothetical protein G6L68_25245 [Agrobacterium fabrum]|uniref:hypothetical protein n=1 Tax=Agrobacterium fabrum TaxID=1176649 RepID=UPI000EF5FB76|nr:hypothetical protein [Agrobacterium fabrum]NTE63940.1 hypothetical protein [Agrobacterium fabrum]
MTEEPGDHLKRELGQSIARIIREHGLTPLHLAKDHESLLRFESIMRGDVDDIPYITLSRSAGAVQMAINPEIKTIEDDW